MKFRYLNADEVDCRVQTVRQNGCSILLYKDARCDQNILDETVGCMNWQRRHSRDNANCTVDIWDEGKKLWVSKEDTGTESNTEKEKGLASDSFKRACFNWGIGRELYTAPFIWIPSDKCTIKEKGQGYTCYDRFAVSEMSVEGGRIVSLQVINLNKGNAVVFNYSYRKTARNSSESAEKVDKPECIDANKVGAIISMIAKKGVSPASLLQAYKVDAFEKLTLEQWMDAMRRLEKYADKESKN